MTRRPDLTIEEMSRLGVGAYHPPATIPDTMNGHTYELKPKDHGRRERVLAVVFCALALIAFGVVIGRSLPL